MKGIRGTAASVAVVLLGGTAALAADLPTKAPAYKAPADSMCASILDFFTTACQVAAYGVRFYGTIDIGGTYQTHATPMSSNLNDNYFLSKANGGAKFLVAPNALSASNIGFQIKEPLGAGWSFVGQVEGAFNPASLQLLNGVHSVFQAIGTPLASQNSFGDSNSQGTFYNDLGFTGVSNDTWGTLTFFRQNDLFQDAILSYDPMGVANAFSALGFFGGFAGGGDTQNRRDTTAIKYRVNLANWHFGAYGQVGGYDEGNGARGGVQGDVGADYHVGPGLLSFDTIAAWKKDAVSLGTGLSGPVDQNGVPIATTTGGLLLNPSATCLAGGNAKACTPINFLSATISNNTSVMATAKYQVDRLKLYAGYQWIQFENPSDPQTSLTDIAGDFLCAGCNTPGTGLVFNGTTISNTLFSSGTKIQQLAWAGAKYSVTDALDVTGAVYGDWQNDFSGGVTNANQANETALTCAQSSTSSSKCAGTRISESVLLDWKFAAKWDTYVGVTHSHVTGGDANGFLNNDIWTTAAGVRFRW
jgi:predicted porin